MYIGIAYTNIKKNTYQEVLEMTAVAAYYHFFCIRGIACIDKS